MSVIGWENIHEPNMWSDCIQNGDGETIVSYFDTKSCDEIDGASE